MSLLARKAAWSPERFAADYKAALLLADEQSGLGCLRIKEGFPAEDQRASRSSLNVLGRTMSVFSGEESLR